MTKRVMLLALAIVFALTGMAHAAAVQKIGIMDMQRALNESKAGQDSKIELEAFIKKRQVRIDEMIKARETLKADIERQAVMLSEEATNKKIAEMQKMEREIDRLIGESNDELKGMQRDKELSILRGLNDIISQYAKEKGYTLIILSEAVVFAVDGMEITDDIIKLFNAKTPEK